MVALWSPEYVCVYSLFRCPPVVKIPNNKALKKYIDGMIDGRNCVRLRQSDVFFTFGAVGIVKYCEVWLHHLHGEQGVVGISRPPGAIPPPHPGGGVAPGVGPNQGSGPPPGYVGNQQQAAMMKQMMAMEQEKRVQMHMMEQQKQQLFREQRQQQQQQLLAEQLQQQQQHLPRQMGQGQRNPYPQVNQYQGPPQDLASRSQALQNIRAARLLQQQQQSQQQMVQMSSVQSQGGSVGPQTDMGLPYGNQGSNQGSLYGLNPSMSQMIHQQQHQSQSVQGSMGLPPQHNPAGGPQRQAALKCPRIRLKRNCAIL
ncbi:hypothetical protein F2P81_010805 [Scophthalmus maximus]|uniref:Uncharacterized protein n=1 Tax=Scophthalmus maximus TaxID=52904 RepID=A0A6A4T405_SCOMX|nr:hypothetical protein F2P81_010805 [Scophthalmus maximus]